MSSNTSEKDFQNSFVDYLVDSNYVKRDNSNYADELCFDAELVIDFVRSTQKEKWNQLVRIFSDPEKTFLSTLVRELNSKGTIHVLKHGFREAGVTFSMFYPRPYDNKNPKLFEMYRKNIFSVIDELKYEDKSGSNRLDIVIFVNGLPISTIELKDTFSQGVENAIKQYKYDRDKNELLFKRCLVHFAMSDEKIYMTTKLDGHNTRFLPFNKGITNPSVEGFYRTSYLYTDILQPRQLSRLINSFIYDDEEDGIIFPRYHQLECVNLLLDNPKPGSNYLIEHSAGSGKTKTIAWLADGLKNLFDENDKRVYDMIIVVSDRRVIDKQLQKQIKAIEKQSGVVEVIDKNSKQLAEALKSNSNIVVTTIHKFSYILDEIKEVPNRKYAIIIDEAHSSQTGSYSLNMTKSLSSAEISDEELDFAEDDVEEIILRDLEKIRDKSNLSLFGFTATPKNKTFELFTSPDKNGEYHPTHLYSMKQAIEEGFILDVLKHYITYKTYFELIKTVKDDPTFDEKQAKKLLKKFVYDSNHAISKKTGIILNHYMNSTIEKIDGKARAMLVTGSRKSAVKYKLEFDKQIKEQNLPIKVLVAFTGTIKMNSIEYTEQSMNNLKNKNIVSAFKEEPYKILIVANKYQTGFDEPLLHTLYVDKKLGGISAVQTLSRVNRIYPDKNDTLILDFVNKKEDIQTSFQPYFQETYLKEGTDYHKLYDLMEKLISYEIFEFDEVENFVKKYYKGAPQQELHELLNTVVERYRASPDDKQIEFKKTIRTYQSMYSFLSQLLPFNDVMLRELFIFNKFLYKKLPTVNNPLPFNVLEDVDLNSYKIDTSNEEESISLFGEDGKLMAASSISSAEYTPEEKTKLSQIIDSLNEAYKTEFTEEDIVYLVRVKDNLSSNEELSNKINHNPLEAVKSVFDKYFDKEFLKILDSNLEFFKKVNDNPDIKNRIITEILNELYEEKTKKE